MCTRDEQKLAAARTALEYIDTDVVVGVGTGSTVSFFIEALRGIKHRLEGAVPSSEETAKKLKASGLPVFDLNAVGAIPIYIDGADEANRRLQLIKGGGGALTREKILAAAAERFICIADESKLVERLGAFPLPVEVLPFARSYVARELVTRKGNPFWREGVITDNGNVLLDVHNLEISDPKKLEFDLDHIAGAVCNGLFAHRPADVLLLGTRDGVKTLEPV